MEDELHDDLLSLLPRFLARLTKDELAAFAARLAMMRVRSGELLYRQGEPSDCMHFVITGRLEVWVRDRHGDRRLVAHLSSGDCVGELSLLTGDARAADVVVIRDAVLARLGREDFDALVQSHPDAGLDIARFALRTLRRGTTQFVPKVRNIALVPLDDRVPIAEFGRRLELALLHFGTTVYADRALVDARRGAARSSRDGVDDRFVDRLLDQSERARRFVICETDATFTSWTRKCVAHADRVLFVGDATHSPAQTRLEKALLESSADPSLMHNELVLLHASRREPPSGTAAWLASREGFRHSHVAWEGDRDFQRLARLLSGNAVTLVLGGGGARGLAEIGAVRAIREAGVPIDAVGGTSIGAIVGALVALDWRDETILQSCKHAFVDDRPLADVTVPLFSLLAGRKLARTLHHYIGDVDIEDLWQPYFCVSSNLSESSVHVHHTGRLWQAMQASAALPGLLPPSIAGGQLYVDGGVLDNLPVGVMKRFIGGNTIAVEATVKVEYSVDTPEFPSPLEYLRSRIVGARDRRFLPTLPNLLIKSTLLGGASGRNELRDGFDLYINPPVREYGFLDWNAIYSLVDVGYRHAQACLRSWLDQHPELRWREDFAAPVAETVTA